MNEDKAELRDACRAELGKRGWKARSAGIGRIDDLEADILGFYRSGAIPRRHLDFLMESWDFAAAKAFPGGASLVVVACPSPLRRLSFAYRGTTVPVILPPIFAERGAFQDSVRAALQEVLSPSGFSAGLVRLPEKLLAARSGLARIGRNRIAYVDGMGSFARLTAFVVDLDLGEDGWGPVRKPERCPDCGACERACPPRILKDDGLPLPYEKCICFLNEEDAAPFPAGLDPSWHNAIIGCMRCQEACPLDAPFMKAGTAGPSFDDDETRTILEWKPGADAAGLPESLSRKLADCGLLRHMDLLPRNLGALVRKEGTA